MRLAIYHSMIASEIILRVSYWKEEPSPGPRNP